MNCTIELCVRKTYTDDAGNKVTTLTGDTISLTELKDLLLKLIAATPVKKVVIVPDTETKI